MELRLFRQLLFSFFISPCNYNFSTFSYKLFRCLFSIPNSSVISTLELLISIYNFNYRKIDFYYIIVKNTSVLRHFDHNSKVIFKFNAATIHFFKIDTILKSLILVAIPIEAAFALNKVKHYIFFKAVFIIKIKEM
jgi:hypothetical protein